MSEQRQSSAEPGAPVARPLVAEDLEDVIALDGRVTGRTRGGYFEKRLAAALREPASHIQVAVADEKGLIGFVLARVLEGEFGRLGAAVTLETIDVEPRRQRQGVGRTLLEGLEDVMRRKGIHELQTEAAWTQHELLRFLDANGFSLAPRQVIACPVGRANSL